MISRNEALAAEQRRQRVIRLEVERWGGRRAFRDREIMRAGWTTEWDRDNAARMLMLDVALHVATYRESRTLGTVEMPRRRIDHMLMALLPRRAARWAIKEGWLRVDRIPVTHIERVAICPHVDLPADDAQHVLWMVDCRCAARK